MASYKKGFLVFVLSILTACNTAPELEWHQESEYHWAQIPSGSADEYGFELQSPSDTGIEFGNHITEEELSENRHYLLGSGVAAGDIDGDGLVDLYFAGLKNSNKLYKNLGGMEFRDITDEAGVAHEDHHSTGVAFADINGNGHLDLLVTSIGKNNALYLNDGSGNFKLHDESGLGAGEGSTTMALADINGDQYLDLYVAKYKEKTVKDMYSTEELAMNNVLNEPYNRQNQTGPFSLTSPFDEHYDIFMTDDNRLGGLAETGEEDELYINQQGSFKKISNPEEMFLDEDGDSSGLARDWGLTAKFQDLNGDGLPDLYVCNDFFTKDKIWINQGEGTFKQIDQWAIRNISFACMGVDFSDVNRDGETDIFTAEMLSPEHSERLRQVGSDDPNPEQYRNVEARPTNNRNSLFLKREDLTYAEIAYLSGVEGSGWSWDATFMDIDLDGYEDLIVNNGYLYHILDIDAQLNMVRKGKNMDEHFTEFMRGAPSLKLRNQIFMNNRDLTFRERGTDLGIEGKDISHGMAVADLNNDGTLDLAINRMNEEAAIYKNIGRAPRIGVRLIGESPNTQAIGAKIKLIGAEVEQKKELASGGSYLSGSDPMVIFAADGQNENHQLVITWPDGTESRLDSIPANRIYEVYEAEVRKEKKKIKDTEEINDPIFEDVSARINHSHHENNFNDFDFQSLLPLRLSQLGPGISWIDIDQDGDDDLLIGSGKGGAIGVFENLGDGEFREITLPLLSQAAPGDQATILGWEEGQGTNILVGNVNYEQGNAQAPSAYQYQVNDLNNVHLDSIPANMSATGPMAAADYDADGDIDLFVGGRFIPGHYPKNATSRLLLNERGSFSIDRTNSAKLQEIGMVIGAVFTDYDRDGDPDLVLSRAWDSILVLENEGGNFKDVTASVGLADLKGWWNGIASGDFNNDGRPDLVVTNRGLNSPYKLTYDNPIRMYYDYLNRDPWVEIIEAYSNADEEYVPRRQLFHFGSIPDIANQINSHEQFANSTLRDLFRGKYDRMPYKEINTLEHMVFLNTGDGFEGRKLPIESQFSISFHAGVADMDNDGNEDLFLSQNLFGVPRQSPRQDAGRGVWLKGDGNGGFSAVSGSKSGIKIYGEQRGAAFSDFNKDGKVDLAVSQNGYDTKLYENKTESRGYRITLVGPSRNRNAIGSGIQLIYKDKNSKGPLREVQAGVGYWSQNSFTQIIGADNEAKVEKIRVIWFDGKTEELEVVEGQKDYILPYEEK
ncbi:FG-GAP-like repeat-containing protein [Aliifodinibius salicampi]|uniref:FG-GAP-like repeat-containing protein n=1 Tax=Fodinibius salicampi TaxID=1920655 RepID=A0ABT3Q0V9_9BACT|nr:FG-GAP-like repeat-containing protein [Fodinibius salicampi]MCW9713753.1 FG-GAP-like repeat-containing protein [Fodinibius salicampi]